MAEALYPVQTSWARRSKIIPMEPAASDPDAFWNTVGARLQWERPWTKTKEISFRSPVSIKWFLDGKLNPTVSCLDRHVQKNPDRIAYTWIPEKPDAQALNITYKMLLEEVCKLANGLRALGVKKGDRVTLYLPMIPEAVYSILACARIGAVHSVIFGGFSPQSIVDRVEDATSDWIITADEGVRGEKPIVLKANIDEALKKTSRPKKVIVVKHTGGDVAWNAERDIWYSDVVKGQKTECTPEIMDAEDPLFVLYTSGSTGKPKGLLHTVAGYVAYCAYTHEMAFDHTVEDVYWCAADIGWITGHSYIVYGPLCNNATSILYEGLPTYPTPARLWEIIDQHKVSILYTAPTLIRSLMGAGEKWLESTSRRSLRVLGSVGEPINPEAWLWYYEKVGGGRCPVVDTWWQTETGGIMISPIPGVTDLKPGSASAPLPGIEPVVMNDKGEPAQKGQTGQLCMRSSWPGQARTIYGDHERFEKTYFSQYPGFYCAGDECRIDEDDFYWIIGRADDVINVSGHRLGTAEVESALVNHPSVAESAVVGFPHAIKGQGIYAFVTLKQGLTGTDELKKDLIEQVKQDIGSLAKPDLIQWAPGLPKTRSGKIMRRILKKIAANDYATLGDITTLADPIVVEELISNRLNK